MKIALINGFSLVEVLISMFILSIAVLGADAMQIYALQANRDAYFFSVAENQLNSMSEWLRGQNSSQTNIIQLVKIWNQQNKEVLPQGYGYVSGSFPYYQITLFWGEKTDSQQCIGKPSNKLKCLSEQVRL